MQMTVTWTSGYSQVHARPVVAYKWEEDKDWTTVVAITRTYKKSDMCGGLINFPSGLIVFGWRRSSKFIINQRNLITFKCNLTLGWSFQQGHLQVPLGGEILDTIIQLSSRVYGLAPCEFPCQLLGKCANKH